MPLTPETITLQVLACLREELNRRHPHQVVEVGLETSLVGPAAVLDSLGLVTFAISLEQRLSDAAGFELNVRPTSGTRQTSPHGT